MIPHPPEAKEGRKREGLNVEIIIQGLKMRKLHPSTGTLNAKQGLRTGLVKSDWKRLRAGNALLQASE
jgi:hypothetical protein